MWWDTSKLRVCCSWGGVFLVTKRKSLGKIAYRYPRARNSRNDCRWGCNSITLAIVSPPERYTKLLGVVYGFYAWPYASCLQVHRNQLKDRQVDLWLLLTTYNQGCTVFNHLPWRTLLLTQCWLHCIGRFQFKPRTSTLEFRIF
jgi:hypothetical protein